MSSRSFRVARSATGLGLFATKLIKRAGYIATYRGRRISTEEAYRRERRGAKYMFELDDRWVIDGSPRWNVARYINHSCSPNAKPVVRTDRVRSVAFHRSGRRNNLQLRTRIFRLLLQEKRLPMHSMPHKGGSPAT